jgi:hypothetical protein
MSTSLVSVLGSGNNKSSVHNELASKDKSFKGRRLFTKELSNPPNHPGGSTGSSKIQKRHNFLSESSLIQSLTTPNRVKSSGGNYQEKMSRTTSSSAPPSPPSLVRTHSGLGFGSFSINERTPETTKITISSNSSNNDRFIPNRSQMRVDLCRASILSADKRRIAAIEKKVSQRSAGENGDPNNNGRSPQNPAEANSSTEMLTPLQSEFRARMRGALLSIPIDDVGSRTPNRAVVKMSMSPGGELKYRCSGSCDVRFPLLVPRCWP